MSVGGLTYSGPLNPFPAEGESRISIYGYYPSLALPLPLLPMGSGHSSGGG